MILLGDAKNQESRCDAVTDGLDDTSTNADDTIVVNKHGVVVPEGAVKGDTLMAAVGDGGSEAGDAGGSWRGRQNDFFGESGRESAQIFHVG